MRSRLMQRRHDPADDDQRRWRPVARTLGLKRTVVGAEREMYGPAIPDEDRNQQEADQQNEGAAFEKCEHGSINR